MKHCNTCNTTKSENDFHKRKASLDGLSARCKSCQSIYDKARANLPKRVEARKLYAESPAGIESVNKAKKKWAKNNTSLIYDITVRYRNNNPRKTKAHRMVSNAVKRGRLIKEPCEICDGENTHAHHDDYAKPLDVRWLCPKHHAEWHKENGEGANADISNHEERNSA